MARQFFEILQAPVREISKNRDHASFSFSAFDLRPSLPQWHQLTVSCRQKTRRQSSHMRIARIKGRCRRTMLQEFLEVPNVGRCPSCGARLAAPEWSEPLGGGGIARMWCCQVCSNSFLTTESDVEKARSWEVDSNRTFEILRRVLFGPFRRRFLNFVKSCQR